MNGRTASRPSRALARAASWALLLSAAGAGCKRSDKPPTQIVLRLDSQLDPGTDVQAISVRVRRQPMGAPVFTNQFTVGAQPYTLPGELGLVAASEDDSGPVYIETQVQLVRGGFFTVNVESSFVPRQVRVVPILLTRDCAARASSGGQCASCSACGCDTVRVDVDGGSPGGEHVEPFAPDFDDSRCQLAHPPGIPSNLPNPVVPERDAGVYTGVLPPGHTLSPRCATGRCFAMRRLRFDWPTMSNPNGWARHGWDLDSTCTTQARAVATCRNPSGVVADGENGRDNAFASRLGPFLTMLMGVSEEQINGNIANGVATLGMEIRGYSGTGDDSSIEVDLFPLVRGRPADASSATPRWDGSDVWNIDRTLVVSGEFGTSRGYIAGSRIVLRLRSQTPVTFVTSLGPSRLLISGGVASGTVHCGGAQIGPLELGGFIEVPQLIGELPYLGVCDPLQTLAVSTAFAQSADLNVVGDMPVNNANVECNAISFGVTIEPSPIDRVLVDENSATIRPNPCIRDSGVGGGDASAPEGGTLDAGSDASDARADAPRG